MGAPVQSAAWENSQHFATPSLVFIPREMTSEKWAQKFHTVDMPLPKSAYCFWLDEAIRGLISGGVARCQLFSQVIQPALHWV